MTDSPPICASCMLTEATLAPTRLYQCTVKGCEKSCLICMSLTMEVPDLVIDPKTYVCHKHPERPSAGMTRDPAVRKRNRDEARRLYLVYVKHIRSAHARLHGALWDDVGIMELVNEACYHLDSYRGLQETLTHELVKRQCMDLVAKSQ